MTFIDGWNHIFSQSDRRTSTGIGLITAITRSSTLAGQEISNFLDAFSGAAAASGGPFYIGHTLVAGTDFFQWQMSEAVAINGLRFWGGDVTDNGMWQVKGSNDGTTFTNIGSAFHWNQVANGIGTSRGCEFTFTNTTPYLYYQLAYVSGTFGGGRLCDRLHFRINHSDLGGGNRSSTVTVTAGPTNLGTRNTRTVADLVDGLYHNGQPTAGADQVTLNAPAANDSIAFAFGSTAVSIKRWEIDGDGQFNSSYGTWQWEGSHNGTTWTASGSSFTLTGNGNSLQLFTTQIPAGTDSYEHWRIKYLSGTTTNVNGMYEFVFDLTEAVSGDATAPGSLITLTMSGTFGTARDVNVSGELFTITSSLSVEGKPHLGAISGGRIYEFIEQQTNATIFQVSDFDSIYSRGDRVANGLLAGGQYGWGTVFSDGSQGFDNIFTGNGPAASTPTQDRPAFWVSSVGGETIDIRGFRLIGEDTISSYANFWVFYGGISPGNYSTFSYFKTIEGYNPNQGLTGSLATPGFDVTFQYTDYFDEPKVYSPWPHYEFIYISGARPDVRWSNEVWFKIAHSNLDGGDRRPGHAIASKTVTLTLSADWSFSTATGFVAPADGLLDGMWEHESAKLASHLVKMGSAADFTAPVTTAGAWMQFQFPRPVIPKHLQFVNFNGNKEVYSGGNPTKFGKWHWEFFDPTVGVWTTAGAQWWFRDNCEWMVAPHGVGTDFGLAPIGPAGQGYSKWRMVLDVGPAFGSGYIEVQVQFDLVDVTGQAPPFEIDFTDDTDNVFPVATIGPPGSPTVVKYSDGIDDGLTFSITNTPNPVLTIDFTDDGQFDTWSDLYPSIVVQTVLVTTGR